MTLEDANLDPFIIRPLFRRFFDVRFRQIRLETIFVLSLRKLCNVCEESYLMGQFRGVEASGLQTRREGFLKVKENI